MSDVYLSLALANFEKRQKEGIKEAKMNGDKENFTFANLDLCVDKVEMEYKDGKLYFPGNLRDPKDLTHFGYLSVNIEIPDDIAIEIIKEYSEKLQKIKEIFDAVKKVKKLEGGKI